MPTNDTNRYETQVENVAIAESTEITALLSQPEISACIGSSTLSVCTTGFFFDTAEDTCLGALLIRIQFAALQNGNINTVRLPMKENAKNLRNGKLLTTLASAQFDMLMIENCKNDLLKGNVCKVAKTV